MKTNKETVKALNQLLSDYQIHYQNLRGLHWNVKGNLFFALHEKYENWYLDAAEVIDEIAERILMLGGRPFHTFGEYLENARLKQLIDVTDGVGGVKAVLQAEEYFLESFKAILQIAGENHDEATTAMISDWIVNTEKRIWMLKAFLG